MLKRTLTQMLVTIIVVGIIVGVYAYINRSGGAKTDGEITFVLVDAEGKEVIHDTLAYKKTREDGSKTTILDILRDNYRVVCADSNFQPDETCPKQAIGHLILQIEDVSTNFFDSYLAIYHNGVYATWGISTIEFADGDRVEIRYTKVD